MKEVIPVEQFFGAAGGAPTQTPQKQDDIIPASEFFKPKKEEVGIIQGAYEGAKKAFKGEGEFDLPEISQASPEQLGVGNKETLELAAGFFLEPSTEGKADRKIRAFNFKA